MSDDLLFDDFLIPEEGENAPKAISARLIAESDALVHLKDGEPHIEFLFRTSAKFKHGRVVLGTCCMPSVQGELRPMFDWMMAKMFGAIPNFLILLDHDFWRASDNQVREILIFHELMHAGQAMDKFGAPKFDKNTGLPVWCIRGHDVEEFNEVVRRYGAWSPDVRAFLEAAGV